MKLYKVRVETAETETLDACKSAKRVVALDITAVTDAFPEAIYIEYVGEVDALLPDGE